MDIQASCRLFEKSYHENHILTKSYLVPHNR